MSETPGRVCTPCGQRGDLFACGGPEDCLCSCHRPEPGRGNSPAERHPHGSVVEQVHRMFSTAYADVDTWLLAEEVVKFVRSKMAEGELSFPCPECKTALRMPRKEGS